MRKFLLMFNRVTLYGYVVVPATTIVSYATKSFLVSALFFVAAISLILWSIRGYYPEDDRDLLPLHVVLVSYAFWMVLIWLPKLCPTL